MAHLRFIQLAFLATFVASSILFGPTAEAEEPLPPPPPPPAAPRDSDPERPRGPAPGTQVDVPEPPPAVVHEPRGPLHRFIRVSALTLAGFSFVAFTPVLALGLDLAVFGQEFHDQARTFSAMNASIAVLWASTTVWPLGLALDGNGDFWATTIAAAAAGGASIGLMYLYAQDDPDKLLAQSFTPGVVSFVTAIVVYEMTSDTSAKDARRTGASDAWISLEPTISPTPAGGVALGLRGDF